MKVKFVPQNIELEIKPNQSVLDLAHQNGIHIQSVCKGVPSCAECRINLAEGEHNVFPPSRKELNLIGTAYFVDRRRLSCQLKCFGDITVDLTNQIEKENAAIAKRPRGKVQKEGESSAVMGNIILEEDLKDVEKGKIKQVDLDLNKAERELIAEETRLALEKIRRRQKQGEKQEDDREES